MATFIVAEIHASTLFKTGHMANRWFSGISRQLGSNVRRAAPMRSGELKGGIHSSMSSNAQGLNMTITLSSSAPHTMHVLRGTTGPIMTHLGFRTGIGEGRSFIMVQGRYGLMPRAIPGYWMHFGGYGYPMVYKDSVAGQSSNNFLLRGWRATAARHQAMRHIPHFIYDP